MSGWFGMGQFEFLHALFETGQVKVGPVERSVGGRLDGPSVDGGFSGGAFPDARGPLDVVREWDAANRLEFPGEAPPLNPATALRAVERFYRACQYTVYREVDAQTVAELFAEPVHAPPGGGPPARSSASLRPTSNPAMPVTATSARATAADHYTVDLVFRFLPELFRLAQRTSGADPLCDGLRLWAGEWPLSSIGMADVNPVDLSAVCDDGGLLRLYADRVIARRDVSRLADPRVRAAVQTALGYYDDLCSPVAKALQAYRMPVGAAASDGPPTRDATAIVDAPPPHP
jgi:hypothetical protein